MPLIDFILDNLFFVMLAVSFLISLLTRKKNGEQEEQQPRTASRPVPRPVSEHRRSPARETAPPMTGHGQPPTNRQPSAERTKPVQSGRLQELERQLEQLRDRLPDQGATSPIAADEVSSPYERPYDEPYRRKTDHPYKRPVDNPITGRIRHRPSIKAQPFSPHRLPEKSVEGMMWSEVFGSPRARKPYRAHIWRK